MKKLFTRRRVQASFGGSLLLHAMLLVGWSDRARPPPEHDEATAISLEVIRLPEPAGRLIAMAGERPSGRGHALAGNNPSKVGTPRHAARAQTARGRAEGSGTRGTAIMGPERGAATPVPQATDQVTPAPEAPDLVPVPAVAIDETSRRQDPISSSEVAASVQADDLFDRLAREQRMRLASGNGGGLAGYGDGNGGTGMGLGTELSGRQVEGSHVVSPPVVVTTKSVECALASSLRLAATVRVLVTRAGEAAVPRLALSSGETSFDTCALRYVLGMRFSPGLDAGGNALDVWMNVRVTPAGGWGRERAAD